MKKRLSFGVNNMKIVYDGNLHDKNDYESYRFLAVESCGVHVNNNYRTVRERGRRDYHLLYVKSGELICLFDGKRERLRAGGYVLYPPSVPQEYEQNEGVCYWVHFSGSSCAEVLSESGLCGAPIFLGNREDSAIIAAFERMIYRYFTTGHKEDFALSSELLSLLACFRGKIVNNTTAYDDRLSAVVSYMHRSYASELDLDECARMTYVSRGRFMHLFKEKMGISPYAYFQRIRMQRAAELLVFSRDSVAEVASKVGFKDALYFSKAFKKVYGSSPSEFRERRELRAPKLVASSGCD